MSVVGSMAELRALLDELAEIDWRHPAWWAVLASTAALERLPARRSSQLAYITSNGDPRADTFMATSAPLRSQAELIATALGKARVAARTLVELDGHYPQQPLQVQLDTRGTPTRRRSANPWRVVFATPTGAFATTLDPDGRGDPALATALARTCLVRSPSGRLTPVDPLSTEPLNAAIAVSLQAEDVATARHLHRRGWNTAGGPWLGIGHTPDLDLVTTSHTVLDGYGHGEIATRIFAADGTGEHSLALAAARRVLGETQPSPAPVLPGAEPLGIATRVVAPTRFVTLTYATAAVVERTYRREWPEALRRRARFTPTLQVPVAPGHRDDPDRLRRRVVPGLISVRMNDGELEPLSLFRRRARELIAREAACGGILTRMRTAAVRAPVPGRLLGRWLAGGVVPRRWLPPLEVLAGRGCVSYLRYDQPPPAAMFAASAPALDPHGADPRGSTVLTAIDTGAGLALTVSGTGLAGTAAGADRFLGQLVEQLDAMAINGTRADTHHGRR